MSSSGHHEYDANLLLATPAPTKGMLQSGYTTDLLEEKPKPPRRDDLESARHNSLSRPTSIPNRSKVRPNVVEPRAASTTSIPKLSPQKTPFYRTRKGIIILVIAAIVILAVVIGGAVGGTMKSKSIPSNSQQISPSGSGNTASSSPPTLTPTKGSGDGGGQGNGSVGGVVAPTPTAAGAGTTTITSTVLAFATPRL